MKLPIWANAPSSFLYQWEQGEGSTWLAVPGAVGAAGPKLDVPVADKWMHAYTYSGHPTCCAVGPDFPERIDPITGHLKLL